MASFPYLTCENLSYTVGNKTLFEGLELAVHPGNRWGILGPNGAGKSTLFSLLCGERKPDAGVISRRNNIRMGVIQQQFSRDVTMTVREILRQGLPPDLNFDALREQLEKDLTQAYEKATAKPKLTDDPRWIEEVHTLQSRLEDVSGHSTDRLIDSALVFGQLMELQDRNFGSLSGGQKSGCRSYQRFCPVLILFC